MTAADVGRNFGGVLAAEAAWAAAGGGAAELAFEAAAIRYAPQLGRALLSGLGNIRPPSLGFLGWAGAVFGAWALGRAIGDVLGDLFKPQMVSSLLTQYDYVQTSDCGIPWVIMSDVYDYPVCGPAFNVPELPAGLSTHRPASITMWGEQVGTFVGNPDRRGSQKWMRTVAAGASVRGFPSVALPKSLAQPNIPALGIMPDVLSWAEPLPVPLSLIAGVPVIEGVREVGYRPPRVSLALGGPFHIVGVLTPGRGRPRVAVSGGVTPGLLLDVRPAFWEREQKLFKQSPQGRSAIAMFAVYNLLGSFNGAVGALWYSLPPAFRTRGAGPSQRFRDVVYNLDRVDYRAALAQGAAFAGRQFIYGAGQGAAQNLSTEMFGEFFGWEAYRAGVTLHGSAHRFERDDRDDVRY